MNKSFYIAFTAWMVFTLALMLIGVYFTTAIFVGTLIAALTYKFFDKCFFVNKKTAKRVNVLQSIGVFVQLLSTSIPPNRGGRQDVLRDRYYKE